MIGDSDESDSDDDSDDGDSNDESDSDDDDSDDDDESDSNDDSDDDDSDDDSDDDDSDDGDSDNEDDDGSDNNVRSFTCIYQINSHKFNDIRRIETHNHIYRILTYNQLLWFYQCLNQSLVLDHNHKKSDYLLSF
jgi:nucleosome binding factor SPN SPT16 subunit